MAHGCDVRLSTDASRLTQGSNLFRAFAQAHLVEDCAWIDDR